MSDHTNIPWSEINLDEVITRLTYFAQRRLSGLTWYGEKGGNTFLGKSAEDFVDDALTKVIEGKRKWNRDKCPEFIHFMFWVIHSDISHMCNSRENRLTKHYENIADHTKEEATVSCDKSIVIYEIVDGFFVFIKADDPENADEFILYTQLKVFSNRARDQIAEEMNMSPEEVDNVRKKWRRKFLKYLKMNNLDLDKLKEELDL